MCMKGRETTLWAGWRSLFFFVIIGCLLVGGVKIAAAAETSRAAKVESVTGTVQIKKAGGTKEYKAFKSMSLNQGDLITTGAESSIVLNMAETAEVTVSENTTVYLSELQEAVTGKKTDLKAWSGSVYIKVKPLTKKDDSFTISTPTAVMGVRGTQLLVGIDPFTGSSSVFVGSGTVATTSLNNRESQNVYPGMMGTYFQQRPGEDASLPDSTASVISPEDLVNSLSPAIIEAMIRNKLMMDEEQDQFIQKLRQQLPPDISQSLDVLTSDELKQYKQNLYNLINAIIVKAIEDNKVSKEQIADLIQQANQDLHRKIDLNSSSTLDLNSKQEAERKKQLEALEQRRQQIEQEQKKKQEQQAAYADLIAKLQAERDRLAKLNEEAQKEAQRKAQEQFEKDNPNAAGSTPGSSGGSGSGNSGSGGGSGGSGGSGSGGSGGGDKEDATITNIQPLSLETHLLKSYTLPATVQAKMSTGSTTTVPVSWNKKAETSLTGVFTFEGTVKGYDPKVQATLKVVAPLGSPVPLLQQRLLFEKGIVLDFGGMHLPSKATATLQSVSPALPAALSPAGAIIDFQFSGIEIKEPVTISFPVDTKVNQGQVGIFHWNGSNDWEYVPTTVSPGVATATVSHFSAYGVLQAPQVADVTATPVEGLVDNGTSISLSTQTPGATIYVKRGDRFTEYTSGDRLTVPGDGETIEAYAAKRNMRDSNTVRPLYSTALASVIDSQHISVSFTQPISVASYDISIPGLPVAAVERNGNSGLTITLGTDTSEMPQQSYTVQFFEGSRYAAQSNSFLLGKVPPILPPVTVDNIEIELEDVSFQTGEFSWDLIENAEDYRFYLNNERITGLEIYHDPDSSRSYLHLFRLKPGKEYLLKVQAIDSRGKPIAEGTRNFSTESLPGLSISVVESGPTSITVTWEPAAYNRQYRFYLDDDETEIEIIYFSDQPFVYTFDDLSPDTEYTLYVKEWPGDFPSAEGKLTVKTKSSESPPPVREFSIQRSAFEAGTQEFHWDTIRDAATYLILQNGEEQGATILDDAGVSSLTLSGFEPGIDYEVKVKVFNAAGDLIAIGTCLFTPEAEEPGPIDPGADPGADPETEPGTDPPGDSGGGQTAS